MKVDIEKKPIKIEKINDGITLTNETITTAKQLDNPNKLLISQIFVKNNGECMVGSPDQIKKREALQFKLKPEMAMKIIEAKPNPLLLNSLFGILHYTLEIPENQKKQRTKLFIENYANKLKIRD